jgi:hypothetical protein
MPLALAVASKLMMTAARWLTNALTRLPTTLNRDIDSLLPRLWKPVDQTGSTRCARCRE